MLMLILILMLMLILILILAMCSDDRPQVKMAYNSEEPSQSQRWDPFGQVSGRWHDTPIIMLPILELSSGMVYEISFGMLTMILNYSSFQKGRKVESYSNSDTSIYSTSYFSIFLKVT